jgi:selenide,water dikinase
MGQDDLQAVLNMLDPVSHERVLVGYETADDAGVYLLDNGLCLVQTIDFFTPVVDDPYDYGRISAANALSDIYAMGAKPLYAISVVCFHVGKLGREPLARILLGAQRKAAEAGVPIIGGHSIEDDEPKFGLSVTGIVDQPDKLVRNSGAKPGDVLVLTKPLGSGIITTAIKQGKATPKQVKTVVEMMSALNREASEAMVEVGVHAATDITGFGLLGHLHEMLESSGVSAIVTEEEVPRLPGLRELVENRAVPGGSMTNLHHVEPYVDWHSKIDDVIKVILCDAQTSGGLLIACPNKKLHKLLAAMRKRSVDAVAIGIVFDGPVGAIGVVR